MPIDPRISLGVQPIQVADPVARYGQLATIQNAQNQNALAQLQLATAQREQESVNALNEAYAKAYDPATGKINRNLLRESLAKGGFGSKLPGIEKTLTEADKEQALLAKTQGEVAAQPITLEKNKADLLDAKLKQSRAFLDTLDPADPNAPAKYIAWHEANHKDPIIGPALAARGITADQSRAQIEAAIAQGPQAFADLVNRSKLGTEKFMEINKPEFEFKEITNPDGTIGVQAINKRTAVAQPVMSNGQIISSPNIPAQRLQFEKDKFAWEQANPGKEIKEVTNADGTVSVFGIDKRTGVATPVTMAAPNQPAPAPAPGQPLVGAKVNAPPSMVAEYTFAQTPEGGSFKGSYQDFVTARAAASRPPAQPQPPVAVVDPVTGKQVFVTREEALRNKMTPASAMEGLPPKEIQAREAKFPAATSAVKTFESSADRLAADLEKLATHPGLSGISGLIYGRTPAITKEARAAQALYDSIVARGGFQELQNMRASSPTGGALGNVSNQEGQYLRDAFAPINRTQDTVDLSRSLKDAAAATRAAKQRVREAYDMTYDYKNQGTTPAAPAKAPAGAVDTNNPLLKGK